MIKFSSLEEVFKAFEQLNVLIIGDVMIDSYIYGKTERISPEAPVPVVNVYKREKRLGGAANVALNVQAMGANPILCSVIGKDEEGAAFLHLLEENLVTTEGIVRSPDRITTVKERVLSGSQHMLRIDSETTKDLNELEQQMILERIDSLAEKVDVIIFEDYDKGTLNPDLIQAIIKKAKALEIPTVVDPKKKNFMSYQGADLFKPNLKELKEGLKTDFDAAHQQELVAATHQLKEVLDLEMALITLSELGVYISETEGEHFLPAHIRSISDVSGAGDTVVSIAALCKALHLPPRLIAGLSNLGGGLVCEHLGVVPINKERLLEEAIKHQELFESQTV